MSPKWTRTKIVGVIEMTPLLLSTACEISRVLVVHGNENPFHHVLICIFVI